MLGYHIRLRPKNSDYLGTTREERRLVATKVLKRGRDFDLTSFGLGGQHLHMYSFSDRPGVGELARRVAMSLIRPLELEGGFEKPYIEPVKDMAHAYNVFTYQLKQERHHSVPCDRSGEGSNLPDLLGMRLLGLYTVKNVKRFLPRVDRAMLLGLLGVQKLEPATGPLDAIVDAGLAAASLPNLQRGGRQAIRLRAALLEVFAGRLADPTLVEVLCVSPRTLRRLKHVEPDAELVQAIRLQLAAWRRT